MSPTPLSHGENPGAFGTTGRNCTASALASKLLFAAPMTLRLVWSAPKDEEVREGAVDPSAPPRLHAIASGKSPVTPSAHDAAIDPAPSAVPERKRISIYELQDLFEGTSRRIHVERGPSDP